MRPKLERRETKEENKETGGAFTSGTSEIKRDKTSGELNSAPIKDEMKESD
jgi:hypothetical protein